MYQATCYIYIYIYIFTHLSVKQNRRRNAIHVNKHHAEVDFAAHAMDPKQYGKLLQQQIEENRRRKDLAYRQDRRGQDRIQQSQDDGRLPNIAGGGGRNYLQPIAPDGSGIRGDKRDDKKKRPWSDHRKRGDVPDPSLQGPDLDDAGDGGRGLSNKDKEMEKLRSQMQWMVKHSQYIEDRFRTTFLVMRSCLSSLAMGLILSCNYLLVLLPWDRLCRV
jgi:hypothetical protein